MITQEALNSNIDLLTLVLDTKCNLNKKYKDVIEGFDELEEPKCLPPKLNDLKSMVSNPKSDDSWLLPEYVQGPDKKFTSDSHVSLFGKQANWNYLTIAIAIKELNNLPNYPNVFQIKHLHTTRKIKASNFITQAATPELSQNLVKDNPIEFVLEVLFGNPNIEWKEAAALVKGLDRGTSSIYGQHSNYFIDKVEKDFVKSPLMLMNNGKNFDRFVLFNELMQATNEPVTEVPKSYRLEQFARAQLTVSKKEVYRQYKATWDKLITTKYGDQVFKGKNPTNVELAFLSQHCRLHTDLNELNGITDEVRKQHIHPIFDKQDKRLLELLAANVSEDFMTNGKKDPIVYFLYAYSKYKMCWNFKSLLE